MRGILSFLPAPRILPIHLEVKQFELLAEFFRLLQDNLQHDSIGPS